MTFNEKNAQDFGKELASIVKEATAPLLARIEELEANMTTGTKRVRKLEADVSAGVRRLETLEVDR